MHTSHVVKQIPPARESVSWDRSVTSFEEAQVGVVSVSMESVGFSFVAKETGIGGEL